MDFIIIHFNGANRCKDKESTLATVVHPISERCENFIDDIKKSNKDCNFERNHFILNNCNVIIAENTGGDLIDLLETNGFVGHSYFTDEIEAKMT